MYVIRDYLAAIIDLEYVRKNVEFNKFIEIYDHFDEIQENTERLQAEEAEGEVEEDEESEERVEGLNQQLTSFITLNNQ